MPMICLLNYGTTTHRSVPITIGHLRSYNKLRSRELPAIPRRIALCSHSIQCCRHDCVPHHATHNVRLEFARTSDMLLTLLPTPCLAYNLSNEEKRVAMNSRKNSRVLFLRLPSLPLHTISTRSTTNNEKVEPKKADEDGVSVRTIVTRGLLR